ncbi:TRAP transporter substrate-binding protein DctP [Nesterenkonia jeotgali]|nr:TRAP transporter substrate-binding protein DctP [Nesterenkonia jeotgali]
MNQTMKIGALGLVGVFALSSCGGGNDAEASDSDVQILRLAHFMEPTHPHETCGMEAMRNHLDGSSIQIETYPAAQLGGETEALEQVYSGNLDMSINGPSFLGVYDERFNVLDAAYLFEDAASQRELMTSGGIDDILEGIYETSGMKVFSGWYYGTRHITANSAVSGPEDLSGLKLRTPDAPLYRVNMAAMGASVTPMALNELYLGLQQQVVDAQENPLPTIQTMNLQEVQSDLSLTGHMVQTLHVSVADNTWSALTEEEQSLLSEAIELGSDAAYDCVVQEEEEILQEFRDEDSINIHEIDQSVFRDNVQAELSEGQPFSEDYVRLLEAQ